MSYPQPRPIPLQLHGCMNHGGEGAIKGVTFGWASDEARTSEVDVEQIQPTSVSLVVKQATGKRMSDLVIFPR